VYVIYCDGIGCNASTKGVYKLSLLEFRAKELLGGLDWWQRDGHPWRRHERKALELRGGRTVAQL
jgi:rhodanese-related sulfurtransferase